MIARGCFIVTILATCVLSWPVPQSRLENEDVKVMKCIVEALADVLSRPQNLPLRQECVDTLRRDERLVSILRHHNFLKELQDIALQGPNGNTQQQSDIIAGHVTKTPQPTEDVAVVTPTSEDVASQPATHLLSHFGDDPRKLRPSMIVGDRSMLEALGGPGERSILAVKRTTAGGGEEERSEKNEESQEGNEIRKDEETSQADENPNNRISDSMNERQNAEEGEPVEKKREDDEDEEEEEEGTELKRRTSEEESEEDGREGDDLRQDLKGTASSEKHDAAEKTPETSAEEEEEEKRSGTFLGDSTESEKEGERAAEGEGDLNDESAAYPRHGSRESDLAPMKTRPEEEEEGQEVRSLEVRDPQEVPHHSKEAVGEEGEEKEQRSPEVKELQMMARRIPTERGAEEEEGSAVRKIEDPEIASLAALESELENVAQKLHELRQG